ncbi:TerD family protein [soil metagenome]
MAINLSKGQKIDLRKDSGEKLTNFCVGVNWGAIETVKKTLFGSKKVIEDVDLDLSCIMTDGEGNLVDYIYSPDYNGFLQKNNMPLGKLTSVDGALKHSGDDRKGDFEGDDGLDNEVITVDLTRVAAKVEKIFFFINIYLNQGQTHDFSKIPYAKIRMYEGTSTKVNKVHSSFDIATDSSYTNKRAIIMGKLYKRNEDWKFDAIGEATEDKIFLQTIEAIKNTYAK